MEPDTDPAPRQRAIRTNRRSRVVDVAAGLLLLHAAVTAVHFYLLLVGTLPSTGSHQQLVEFAVADTVATILPSAAGAAGMFRRRAWGWALGWLVVGGYLHGMAVLIVRGMSADEAGVMTFVSCYFLAGALVLAVILARFRGEFRFDR